MKSKSFRLNKDEVFKWIKNTLIFLAPALLVFLTVIQSGGTLNEALIALYLWVLNTSIDLLKKFIQSNK